MDRILLALGFEPVRRRGSHVFYRHRDGRTTSVPDHGSRVIARFLLREILREAGIATDEFERRRTGK